MPEKTPDSAAVRASCVLVPRQPAIPDRPATWIAVQAAALPVNPVCPVLPSMGIGERLV
jgi:hypothetical protein